MRKALADDRLNQIFREVRTHNAWLEKPIPIEETMLRIAIIISG